jgi:DNA mismatch repair protein MLH1
MTIQDASNSSDSPRNSISVLPREVVDQIAAGEVVQRPVSVVKELLENSLDAGSSHIVVHIEKGGLNKLSISDDGCGISKSDLTLAATRHATSKLSTVEDFANLGTFGFRGEALASISTVSRLTVTTRTEHSSVGFQQAYRNGVPTAKNPKPCARKKGTTILVQDLFYNVPHRLKTYSKRESDEYSRILNVVQHYAIHYPYAGFVCERLRSSGNKTLLVDLNTSQLLHVKSLIQKREKNTSSKEDLVKATKQVMAHVFESSLEKHLSHFEASQTGMDPSDFAYDCQVFFTSPSHDSKTTKFVLFLNDRLVDLPVLKRALEDVYSNFSKSKPVIVVKIKVPGTQVDVNVHPSKRQVALTYQDELCTAISTKLSDSLKQYGQFFQAQSVAPVENPYRKKRKKPEEEEVETGEASNKSKKMTQSDLSLFSSSSSKFPVDSLSAQRKKVPPSKLIRTSGATPVGAIEPFLVPTQSKSVSSSKSQSQSQSSSKNSTPTSSQDSITATAIHVTTCPLSNASQSTTDSLIDFSQPGAFAAALRCNCPPDDIRRKVMIKEPPVRPKRVTPTKCTYSSIASLRKSVNKQTSTDLAKDFRDAYFVGTVSHQRSLIQCGENLVMINHLELAKILFYQLSLARFGGATMAQLASGGVSVKTLIAQLLQMEDDLILPDNPSVKERLKSETGLLLVNEDNESYAQEVTNCLMDQAGMLEEYFSIRMEKDGEDLILTGLPVLLDGHAPEPHGLSILLLRLATQVNWSEERSCFYGICQELGNYYAMLPSELSESYVRHNLFPALSYLLLPPERIKTELYFTVMTKLSTLYKVFERC